MLAACATVREPTPAPADDPVVEVRTETRLFCPPDLWRDAGADPAPADDATVDHNASGGAWLDDLIAVSGARLSIILAARKACELAGAAPQ